MQLDQAVIVENIGGASGVNGKAAVAKAAPDGHTIGVVCDTHAVSTSKRSKNMPNVPTIAESGFPGFGAPAWWGVIGPANMPPAITSHIHAAEATPLKNQEVAKKLEAQGIDLVGGGPEVFKPFVEKQMTTWSALIKANNITE